MRVALDNVVQDFIVSNGKIAQSYFDLSGKIIDSLCDSHASREAVLMRLLDQAQNITAHYFNAHQQVVQGLYLNQPESADAHRLAAPLAVTPLPAINEPPLAPAPAAAAPAAASAPYEQWLREEISAVNGLAPADIDLRQPFDALGLDSLSRVDLFDALAKAFPQVSEHATGFFDLTTPTAVLAVLEGPAETAGTAPDDEVQTRVTALLAGITGFAIADIDLQQPYEQQGLDSLVRLDFLALLSQQWPCLKAHESALADALCAQQTIEQINALLGEPPSAAPAVASDTHDRQLRHAMTPLLDPTVGTPDSAQPFADLGFNGFDRAALCQNMAQGCKTSEFAGEALMSRRSPSEASALLARMS